MPDIPSPLQPENQMLWILIGVCVALVFTLEAVHTAIDGAWPHQRRPSRMLSHERTAQTIWGLVAIFILIGGLLTIANLGILLWQDLDYVDGQVLAGILLAIAWVVFLLMSIDRFGIRAYLSSVGPVAPLAILVMLIIANILFALTLADIWPSLSELRDSLPVIDGQ
jgi:hypothetical protein